MKIEYIIEGNEYESQLYELISQKYDKIKLSSQYRKIDKQNNSFPAYKDVPSVNIIKR